MTASSKFSKTLSGLMTESGFSSTQKFYEFLGGERILGVSSVYFGNWLKGSGIPRAEKLDCLINSFPKQSSQIALFESYMDDLFAEQKNLSKLLNTLIGRKSEPEKSPVHIEHNAKIEQAPLEMTIPQLNYLASNIDHYRVFSVLLVRRIVAKKTTEATLSQLLQLPLALIQEILLNFTRFDLIEKKQQDCYMLVTSKIVWPKLAEAKPALLLLNDYDKQIFAVMNNRVRNRSLTMVLPTALVEAMDAEIRLVENKYYKDENQSTNAEMTSVVYYHSLCYASKAWIES
jgi:hypothetical protein